MNKTKDESKKRFLSGLKHAFAVEPSKDFSPEDIALLDKVANAVIKRKMTIPAIMFLESVRPLNFIGSQAMVFFQPVLSLVCSTVEFERMSQILEKRKSVQILIDLIENKSSPSGTTEQKNNA